jgi:hypothetical protein
VIFDRTPVIRAMLAAEIIPPDGNQEMSLSTHEVGDDIWSGAVRWTDTAGQRWELTAPQDAHAPMTAPRRLRQRTWQKWRNVPEW